MQALFEHQRSFAPKPALPFPAPDPEGQNLFANQFHESTETARTIADVDNLARILWRCHADGRFTDDVAQSIAEALQARRVALRPMVGRHVKPKAPPRRRPASHERLALRRKVALGGVVPAKIAMLFTMGEIAALAVIGTAARKFGDCRHAIGEIARLAGVGKTTVQNAIRHAERLGIIRRTERRVDRSMSMPNVIEVVSPLWRAWLSRGVTNDWAQKFTGKKKEVEHSYTFDGGRRDFRRPRTNLFIASVLESQREADRLAAG
jgi:hypothetical protein